MKQSYFCLLFLLLLFSGKQINAQPNYQYPVTFHNPFGQGNPSLASDFFADGKYVDDPAYPVSVPSAGVKQVKFFVYLYRQINSTSGKKGYVSVYLGNSSASNPIGLQTLLTTSNGNPVTDHPKTDNATWRRINNSSWETTTLYGAFNISASALTPQNGFNSIYAVFNDTQVTPNIQVERSHPIYLQVDAAAPTNPTSPSNPSGPFVGLSAYLPCGSDNVICSDQCIPYGTRPATIEGRILADKGDSGFNYYAKQYEEFAVGHQYEWAQWQVSYDNINWSDISEATSREYSPGVCYKRTYYRRVSTHLEYTMLYAHREYWYTSNVVTITPQAPAPIPYVATFSTCAGGNVPVSVNVNPSTSSYNWWVNYPGWSVSADGQNFYSTYNNQSSYTTPATKVYLNIPAGTSPGTYYIAVSANGLCGPKSPDGIITVNVTAGNNPTSAPTNASLLRIGSDCSSSFDVIIPPVTNATSYSATIDGRPVNGILSNGNVLFRYRFPIFDVGYQISGTIYASGSCNTVGTQVTLNVPGGGRRCAPYGGRSANTSLSLATYPNPASEEITMETDGDEAVALFYDANGTLRKKIRIAPQTTRTSVNVRDLPAGIYHLHLVLKDEKVIQKQFKIVR